MRAALPVTQYLIIEVLAARFRCGEPFWTFPLAVRWDLSALAGAGIVEVIGGGTSGRLSAKLTERGRRVSLSVHYQLPVPALANAIAALPTTDEHYTAWLRWHGLGHSADVATVISAVRADLLRLANAIPPQAAPHDA